MVTYAFHLVTFWEDNFPGFGAFIVVFIRHWFSTRVQIKITSQWHLTKNYLMQFQQNWRHLALNDNNIKIACIKAIKENVNIRFGKLLKNYEQSFHHFEGTVSNAAIITGSNDRTAAAIWYTQKGIKTKTQRKSAYHNYRACTWHLQFIWMLNARTTANTCQWDLSIDEKRCEQTTNCV